MVDTWLSTALVRYYPSSPPRRRRRLFLHAARDSAVAFQVAFHTRDSSHKVQASVEPLEPLHVTIRRVGYVPVRHFSVETPKDELDGIGFLPGLAPDPLFPDFEIHAGAFEANAFWITVTVPRDARPGRYPLAITLTADGQPTEPLTATLRVHRATLEPLRDFPVTHWFYADSICDWYKTELWEESFWPIVNAYFADIVAHGQNTLLVPVFTPPTDGVKRPTQLLRVSRQGDRYSFDWSLVRRWIETAKANGVEHFEWNHLLTQWGAKNAIRVYEGHGEAGKLMWDPETLGVSQTYRDFLSQYLPELQRFAGSMHILDRSFFHLSDEPHGAEHLANYRAARQMLREIAPWMKVMDALSQIEFAREGLVDIPIPVLDQAPEFVREGFPAWTYFWSGPRGPHLNRLIDVPLAKLAMAGWLFYRNRARGFLHWGYNYWYRSQTRELIDPYTVNDAHNWPSWSPGDPFQVYPGEAGPVDSMRWEVWRESLQDYALLQTAALDPDDPMLSEIVDYATFPKTASWLLERRRALLRLLDE